MLFRSGGGIDEAVNKVHQIDGLIYSSPNMVAMDGSLLKLYKDKVISRETALAHATNPDMLAKKL